MSEPATYGDARVLLITGASSRDRRRDRPPRACEAAGALVLAARSLERLQELAEELGGSEHALAVRCDVTEWERPAADGGSCARGVRAPRRGVRQRRLRRHRAAFSSDTPEHWREMVLTNVYGAALTIRAAIPALSDTRGHLLLTSSVAGRRVLPGSLYSCTKHAVTAMGEAARQDLNGTGVRVTLIEPGMVDTPFFDQRPTDALQDDDIARAVLYALSPAARTSTSTRSSSGPPHSRAERPAQRDSAWRATHADDAARAGRVLNSHRARGASRTACRPCRCPRRRPA